jgi:hypothetical protein
MRIHESLELLAIPGVAEIFHEFREFRDRSLREALKDQGFRVVGIASSRPLAEQIAENADVFRNAYVAGWPTA